MYTRGVRFVTGRVNSRAALPRVLELIARGGLRPERVTSEIVPWDRAAEALAQPSLKPIVVRGAHQRGHEVRAVGVPLVMVDDAADVPPPARRVGRAGEWAPRMSDHGHRRVARTDGLPRESVRTCEGALLVSPPGRRSPTSEGLTDDDATW